MIKADEAKCCANLYNSESERCALIAIDLLIRHLSQNGKFACIWESCVLSEAETLRVVAELRKNGYLCAYDIGRTGNKINISWK